MGYSNRSNLWGCIIYPGDSAPADYLNIIQSWHIPALLSPIHDADKNTDDSEKKKHQHLMLYFGSGCNKSLDQVKLYTDQLNSCLPIIINNRNAMVRYYVHKDNPEKHQYRQEDLICISGFEIGDAFDSFSNDDLMFNFIEETIRQACIYNYAQLVEYLKDNGFMTELSFLRRHGLHIRYLLDGYKQLVPKKKT